MLREKKPMSLSNFDISTKWKKSRFDSISAYRLNHFSKIFASGSFRAILISLSPGVIDSMTFNVPKESSLSVNSAHDSLSLFCEKYRRLQ